MKSFLPLARSFKDAFSVWFRKIKLRNKIASLVALVVFLNNISSIFSFVSGLWDPLATKADTSQLGSAIMANGLQAALGNEKIMDRLDSSTGIPCETLEEGDWTFDQTVEIDHEYLLLKDGKTAGSIHMTRSFFDAFIFQFVFIPEAVVGINTTLSLKDDIGNELSISFGDAKNSGSPTFGFDYYKATLDHDGEEIGLGGDGNQIITPPVKGSNPVTLRIETLQQASDLLANAYILYTPSKKPDQVANKTLFLNNIPYFNGRYVHLNVGLRRMAPTDNPKITIVDCTVQPKKPL